MSRKVCESESEPVSEPTPEFSRLVVVEEMSADVQTRTLAATPAECQALARRFELVALGRLEASVRLRRFKGGQMVEVRGRLSADVVQTCVVSLDPVPNTVEERFSALFAVPALMPETEMELMADPAALEEDLPEPMVGGRIDLGELTAQHLSLALDPYPRKPGVEFVCPPEAPEAAPEPRAADRTEEAPAGPPNPFAALAALKRRG
jgi:uncharacterized metal-binding protein YceD (DUF177 family)